jgi:hypothetical protein
MATPLLMRSSEPARVRATSPRPGKRDLTRVEIREVENGVIVSKTYVTKNGDRFGDKWETEEFAVPTKKTLEEFASAIKAIKD